MLEKYLSLFDGLHGAEKLLHTWGYSEHFIENFPRYVALFVLTGICLGLLKVLLMILHVVPSRSKKALLVEERVKGEIKLVGIVGGGFANIGSFFGMMAVNMGKVIPTLLHDVFFDFDVESLVFKMIARIITVIVALLYLAVICGLFTPLFMLFKNNMKVYGWWGIFETMLNLFLGLSFFVLAAILMLFGSVSMLPLVLSGFAWAVILVV